MLVYEESLATVKLKEKSSATVRNVECVCLCDKICRVKGNVAAARCKYVRTGQLYAMAVCRWLPQLEINFGFYCCCFRQLPRPLHATCYTKAIWVMLLLLLLPSLFVDNIYKLVDMLCSCKYTWMYSFGSPVGGYLPIYCPNHQHFLCAHTHTAPPTRNGSKHLHNHRYLNIYLYK